HAGHLL
ncbi:hypothetical protein BN1708_018572, partial [Verticillium longisporum]